MAARPDISDKVIHFTSADAYGDALGRLMHIIGEGCLHAGNGKIKGGYRCVCFTEAPLPALAGGLVNSDAFSRYSPYGLMFEKAWLYAQGGRPVIYQPDSEFDALPEPLRWRHVRYEPEAAPAIDFTWEREWRIRCDALPFSPAEAVIVVPDDEAEQVIRQAWDIAQDLEAESYSQVMEHALVQMMRAEFPWRVVHLA